jgi:pimeloyl-ACP methyl ester carboxylesterase
MTEPNTRRLALSGATLTYDVREADSEGTKPVLLMVGSPMDASGFTTLADHFPDRTVVTYDPRGVGRSPRADGLTAATPDEHAEDLHRLIYELDAGPVDIFGSSGGAVNALALVTRHPEAVRTLVAHEPPLATVLAGGAESEGTFPYRAALAVVDRLGSEVMIFPSHHGGFTEQGDPDRSPPPCAGSSRTSADRAGHRRLPLRRQAKACGRPGR